MRIDEFEFRNEKGQEIEPTKAQLVIYIKSLHKDIKDLEAKLAESEKKHLLDEKEWQDYCAFKHIEPQIKGCLDRERKLKQQLAEMTEKYNACQEARKLEAEFSQQDKKELIQQLAEKEKEIEDLKFMMRNTEQALNNVPNAMAGQRKRIDELTKELKQTNQDKISFAIEQLEKAKEILLENLYDLYSKPSEIWDEYGDLYDVAVEDAVNGTIDNQIKKLKEGCNETVNKN